MSFEGANNKFIHITLYKIKDLLNNLLISMKYIFYEHILCFIIQRTYIKVFHVFYECFSVVLKHPWTLKVFEWLFRSFEICTCGDSTGPICNVSNGQNMVPGHYQELRRLIQMINILSLIFQIEIRKQRSHFKFCIRNDQLYSHLYKVCKRISALQVVK